jgi:hypothetical protein
MTWLSLSTPCAETGFVPKLLSAWESNTIIGGADTSETEGGASQGVSDVRTAPEGRDSRLRAERRSLRRAFKVSAQAVETVFQQPAGTSIVEHLLVPPVGVPYAFPEC